MAKVAMWTTPKERDAWLKRYFEHELTEKEEFTSRLIRDVEALSKNQCQCGRARTKKPEEACST